MNTINRGFRFKLILFNRIKQQLLNNLKDKKMTSYDKTGSFYRTHTSLSQIYIYFWYMLRRFFKIILN